MNKIGDRRERFGFAWFPVKIAGKLYFLKPYIIKEVYNVVISHKGLISHDWIPEEETIIRRNPIVPKGYDKARGAK